MQTKFSSAFFCCLEWQAISINVFIFDIYGLVSSTTFTSYHNAFEHSAKRLGFILYPVGSPAYSCNAFVTGAGQETECVFELTGSYMVRSRFRHSFAPLYNYIFGLKITTYILSQIQTIVNNLCKFKR